MKAARSPANPVLQGYFVYNPGAAAGQYQANLANQFTTQTNTGVGTSFMDPITLAPRINHAVAPAVRVSQSGLLAIEDANLGNAQPKHFYAEAGQLQAWNQALMATGSYFQLVPVGSQTISFTMPPVAGGHLRTLVKVEARNMATNNQGQNMTIAQHCDSTVKEVTGAFGEPRPIFQNAPAIALPAAHTTVHATLQQYYVAAELAQVAGVGAVGGGMPGAGMSLNNDNLKTEQNDIARNYGQAMWNHGHVAHDAALDARMMHLGINQYAVPAVGQGLVTHTMGAAQAGVAGPIHEDAYNHRDVNAPGNNNMWRYHWGGVVARDAGDFITLENYARNAEDGLGGVSNDPRFYFQMYGPGAQSWHAAWSALGGGREFANPLTMVVSPGQNPNTDTEANDRAHRYFGNNIGGIKDDHHTIAGAGSVEALTVALYKALAYANAHLNATGPFNTFGRWSRVRAWRDAVGAAHAHPHANAQTNALSTHVLARLGQMRRDPFNP